MEWRNSAISQPNQTVNRKENTMGDIAYDPAAYDPSSNDSTAYDPTTYDPALDATMWQKIAPNKLRAESSSVAPPPAIAPTFIDPRLARRDCDVSVKSVGITPTIVSQQEPDRDPRRSRDYFPKELRSSGAVLQEHQKRKSTEAIQMSVALPIKDKDERLKSYSLGFLPPRPVLTTQEEQLLIEQKMHEDERKREIERENYLREQQRLKDLVIQHQKKLEEERVRLLEEARLAKEERLRQIEKEKELEAASLLKVEKEKELERLRLLEMAKQKEEEERERLRQEELHRLEQQRLQEEEMFQQLMLQQQQKQRELQILHQQQQEKLKEEEHARQTRLQLLRDRVKQRNQERLKLEEQEQEQSLDSKKHKIKHRQYDDFVDADAADSLLEIARGMGPITAEDVVNKGVKMDETILNSSSYGMQDAKDGHALDAGEDCANNLNDLNSRQHQQSESYMDEYHFNENDGDLVMPKSEQVALDGQEYFRRDTEENSHKHGAYDFHKDASAVSHDKNESDDVYVRRVVSVVPKQEYLQREQDECRHGRKKAEAHDARQQELNNDASKRRRESNYEENCDEDGQPSRTHSNLKEVGDCAQEYGLEKRNTKEKRKHAGSESEYNKYETHRLLKHKLDNECQRVTLQYGQPKCQPGEADPDNVGEFLDRRDKHQLDFEHRDRYERDKKRRDMHERDKEDRDTHDFDKEDRDKRNPDKEFRDRHDRDKERRDRHDRDKERRDTYDPDKERRRERHDPDKEYRDRHDRDKEYRERHDRDKESRGRHGRDKEHRDRNDRDKGVGDSREEDSEESRRRLQRERRRRWEQLSAAAASSGLANVAQQTQPSSNASNEVSSESESIPNPHHASDIVCLTSNIAHEIKARDQSQSDISVAESRDNRKSGGRWDVLMSSKPNTVVDANTSVLSSRRVRARWDVKDAVENTSSQSQFNAFDSYSSSLRIAPGEQPGKQHTMGNSCGLEDFAKEYLDHDDLPSPSADKREQRRAAIQKQLFQNSQVASYPTKLSFCAVETSNFEVEVAAKEVKRHSFVVEDESNINNRYCKSSKDQNRHSEDHDRLRDIDRSRDQVYERESERISSHDRRLSDKSNSFDGHNKVIKGEHVNVSRQERAVHRKEMDSSSSSSAAAAAAAAASVSKCSTESNQLSRLNSSLGKRGVVRMALAPVKTKQEEKLQRLAALTTPSQSVLKAFADESGEDEDDEQPELSRLRMRNVGRDTPTSAGPNSYFKSKRGFLDQRVIHERRQRELEERVAE